MSTERVSLGFSSLTVPSGSHIAYPYQAEAQSQEHLLAFISTGLRNNEKCIAAVSEYLPGFWQKGLLALGVDMESVPEGQFAIITPSQLSCGSGVEFVHTAVQTLHELTESSVAEGWAGTRICTGFNYLYHNRQALDHLLAAESVIDHLPPDKMATTLCTYAENRLHPKLLDVCLNYHPMVTDGDSLAPNRNYLGLQHQTCELPEILAVLRAEGALTPPFALLDFCGDVPVIHSGEELDISTTPALQDLADWMVNIGHSRLVIDLSATTFMDAASIGMIVRIALLLEGRHGRLAVYDPRMHKRRIFQLSRIWERITIVPSIHEALSVVSS